MCSVDMDMNEKGCGMDGKIRRDFPLPAYQARKCTRRL
jgi:hypothetical protein